MRSGAWALWTKHNFAVRIPLMALLIGGLGGVIAINLSGAQPIVGKWRNFYGILRVTDHPDPNGAMRELTHGRIKHGSQYHGPSQTRPADFLLRSAQRRRDRAERSPGGPPQDRRHRPGNRNHGRLGPPRRPHPLLRNQSAGENIATTWFTFLPDSKAKTDVVLGDARIQMERELSNAPAEVFDLIVVDAFSSDAIPMHLLTAEAADIYRKRLIPGGLLLFHISNRSLNLEPVSAASPNTSTGTPRRSWPTTTLPPEKMDRAG